MEGKKEIRVVIGGKTREIRFGLGATRIVCKYHGIRLEQLAENLGIDALFQDEIYGGLKQALALKGLKPDFSYAQVMEWIDDMPQPEFQELFDKWLLVNQHGETRYEKMIKVLEANNTLNNGAAADEKKN